MRKLFRGIPRKNYILNLAGAFLLAVGCCSIHARAPITEGGMIGLTLLLHRLWGLSPAWTNPLLTALCFFYGWRTFGKDFLVCSAVACGSYSVFYLLVDMLPPLFPSIASYPLEAAVLGSVFIGCGAGLCVRGGGAQTGDDALAMALSHRTGIKIQWVYLLSDLTVLLLSLIYIPPHQILYSLLTVVLSGQLIGLISGGSLPFSRRAS